MGDWHTPQGPFDIPDIPGFVPRRLKPWLFILFVLIVQFSGGIYLAAVTDMVGSTALKQEDILMAGYASLIGMSINFAVMFRIKFRFSTRSQLLVSGTVLLLSTIICANTESVPVLVATSFVAGWFRMQATFACNSTIQLWITPVRDMAVFFCYVYIIVDSVIQLSGIATVYSALLSEWEYMHWIMGGMLGLMLLLVLWLVRPVRGPMYIPLLGIDWIGSLLWSIAMLSFTFICVYGNFYDWWDAVEIQIATLLCIASVGLNLWRAGFLHHPYISFMALKNRNVIRASIIYLVFFTLLSPEHIFEHTFASSVLGFDEQNLIDLNWYVLIGIVVGCGFTYYTFACRKWAYRTMASIAFALAIVYFGWFYFQIDYGLEKEMFFIPLFFRGMASVIISIVLLTSIVQSGLPFTVFPQALTINGFTGAVMGVAFCPAILGEIFRKAFAKNLMLLSSDIVDFNPMAGSAGFSELAGLVQVQSLVVSMKEVYGLLLIIAFLSLIVILMGGQAVRPMAIFPKWRSLRKSIKHLVRLS